MDLIRDCLGFRVSSAYRRVDRMFNRAFERLGIPHAHGQILICLLQDGEMRVADVAARTGFDPSTVSRLVKELARRRLVARRRNPDDGRSLLLSLAKRGEALRGDIERIQERLNHRLRSQLTEADLEGFERTIRVMERLP